MIDARDDTQRINLSHQPRDYSRIVLDVLFEPQAEAMTRKVLSGQERERPDMLRVENDGHSIGLCTGPDFLTAKSEAERRGFLRLPAISWTASAPPSFHNCQARLPTS